ncbi:Protein of unknown function [Gryllus bimaculatus]|nr:Protein of unknown function [Gryllus bimaculatus]
MPDAVGRGRGGNPWQWRVRLLFTRVVPARRLRSSGERRCAAERAAPARAGGVVARFRRCRSPGPRPAPHTHVQRLPPPHRTGADGEERFRIEPLQDGLPPPPYASLSRSNERVSVAGDIEAVSQKLVQLSKQQGSTDNISVIVAFLTDPCQLAARAREQTVPRAWAPTNGPQQPSAPQMEAFDMDLGSAAPPPPPLTAPATDALPAATNPFEVEMATQKAAAAAAVSAAGAGLLLDDPFQAPPFNNGHTNGNLFDFMDIARNGKASGDHKDVEDDDDDDEDSGPEAVDGADATHAPLPPARSANPFGEELELQRQQTSDFDPENEPRHDTPTPPADEVPGVLGLVSDNVAESGEESEDEWNYYRADPKEKSEECPEKEQQTKPEVCKEQTQKSGGEEDDNMESQLNPNAAEFIPSPTHNMPSMEEILTKAQTVEESCNETISSVNTSELLLTQEQELDKQELSTSQQEEFVNPLNIDSFVEGEFKKELGSDLNESTAFSTKAEFGDESVSSSADFQKILDTSSNIMETSLMGQDFLASDEQISGNVLEDTTESSVIEKESVPQQDLISDFQKEPVHISFELQKEIAPQMESEPERVKVDSDDQSPTLDTEPEMPNVNSVTENNFVDNLDLVHEEEPVNNAPVLEDFTSVSNHTSQNVDILGNMGDNIGTNIEDKIGAADFLRDDVDFLAGAESKQPPTDNLLEFSQTKEKIEFEGSTNTPAALLQKDFPGLEVQVEASSQLSESPLSELTDELPVQQEIVNQLSNEISTPEYEKLEKDLEASEQYQDKFNSTKENIPVDFSSVEEENLCNTSDVLLECAHPDKVALLDDACAESVPSENNLMENVLEFTNGPMNAPTSDLFDSCLTENVSQNVPQDSGILDNLIQIESNQITESVPGVDIPPAASLETNTANSVSPLEIETETVSKDYAFIESSLAQDDKSVHIPTHEVMQPEFVHNELLESTQAPPPTPLITDLAEREPLNFGNGTENFTEIVEKLSESQQSGSKDAEERIIESEMSREVLMDKQIIENLPETSASLHSASENVGEAEKIAPESVNDTNLADSGVSENAVPDTPAVSTEGVLVATAAVAAAAATATTAISAFDNKDSKKEKDVPTKKPTIGSVKDKKPGPEKPKTATKSAVSSRLSTTAAKPKSPTSPVKPPSTQKTAPAKPLTTASTTAPKPLSKPSVPKTTSRPLSSTSTRPATTAATKPKPVGLAASKSVPAVGLAKNRPTSSPSEKKPITNGDVKASKRPEQLTSKTMTTTKTTLRPATAPATRTVSKTVSSVTSTVAKTKSPLNGPSKPKPLTSVSTVRSVAKASNEKEIKETANKQISTRTTTSTVRSTTTTTASKSSVTSASRKIESKVITNGKGPAMKPSGMIKTTTTSMPSRIPPKKPATTTRVKAAKTESIVEKSETVQGSKTVIAMSE